MKKLLILFLLTLVLISSGCTSQGDGTNSPVSGQDTVSSDHIEKVEIIHFHRHQQCYSCITLGQYAEETVNVYFADELESGKVVFGHKNVQLPENAEITEKYGATGSSLWIGVYDDNGFHAEENTNVWYKLSNREEFIEYLKGVIEEKLQSG